MNQGKCKKKKIIISLSNIIIRKDVVLNFMEDVTAMKTSKRAVYGGKEVGLDVLPMHWKFESLVASGADTAEEGHCPGMVEQATCITLTHHLNHQHELTCACRLIVSTIPATSQSQER